MTIYSFRCRPRHLVFLSSVDVLCTRVVMFWVLKRWQAFSETVESVHIAAGRSR